MRRFLFLSLLVCFSFTASAQDFKIIFVNTGTIKIGGKDLGKGDVFNESDKIVWVDSKQAMTVLSLSDFKEYVFASPDFEQRKLKSTRDYLVKSNRLSTRGSGSLSSVERQIGETLYVMDTTRVAISYVPDETEYFFLVRDGNRYELEYKDGVLIFTPEIWGELQEPVTVDLYFRHSDNEEELVIEGLGIVPLPETIQTKKAKRR